MNNSCKCRQFLFLRIECNRVHALAAAILYDKQDHPFDLKGFAGVPVYKGKAVEAIASIFNGGEIRLFC